MFYYKNKKEIYKSLLDIIMKHEYNEYERGSKDWFLFANILY